MIKIKIKNSIKKSVNERQSDIDYGNITNFFYNILKEPKKFQITKFTYKYNDEHLGESLVPCVSIHDYLSSSSSSEWIAEYKRYREETGDEGKIIKSLGHFMRAIKDLYILILPRIVRPDALGDMSNSGEMRIFLPTWNVKPATTSEADVLNSRGVQQNSSEWFEQLFTEKVNSTLEKAKDGILAGRFADYIEETLSHELVHYLNAIRSSGEGMFATSRKVFRASGGEKGKYLQFKTRTKEYARSTEEWQARLGEGFHYIQKATKLQFPDIEKDLAAIDNGEERGPYKLKYKKLLINSKIPEKIIHCLMDIKNKNFQGFYDDFSKFNRFEYYSKLMDEKSINRYKKRVASLYKEYESKKELYPIFKVFDITFWFYFRDVE